MSYPLHEKAVKIALGELGVREDPMGSNTGKRVQEFQAATWLGGTRWAWCVAFGVWGAKKAGFKVPHPSAGAYDMGDWARSVGWTTTLSKLVPGDWVVWGLGAGHMSIYLSHDAHTIRTIDGNVSDCVDYRVRSISLARNLIHLPEKPSTVPKPSKPPTFEVVSGLNGAQVFYSGGDSAHVAARLQAILKAHPKGVIIRPRPKGKN